MDQWTNKESNKSWKKQAYIKFCFHFIWKKVKKKKRRTKIHRKQGTNNLYIHKDTSYNIIIILEADREEWRKNLDLCGIFIR